MSAQQLYDATLAHFRAQREEAIAVLQLCFTNPVAVGDHVGLVGDIKEWVQKLAAAEDAMATLQRNFRLATDPPGVPKAQVPDPDP